MPGVESTGWVSKDLATILTEIETDERALIQADLNVAASSLLGNLNGIFGARAREVWEKGQEAYASQYPDTATGVSLDNVCAITGTVRTAASKSTLSTRLNLDDGVTVPTGSVVAEDVGSGVASLTNRFVTTAPVSNSSGGNDDFDIVTEGQTTGPLTVPSTPVALVIVTPISGWITATALASPGSSGTVLGVDDETDSELRARREREIAAQGSSSVDGLRGNISQVEGVTSVDVLENITLAVDGDGLPGKSFRAIVFGGTDADIAQAIWDNKPTGIESDGAVTEVVTDDKGNSQSVKFSRATQIDIYLEIDVTALGVDYPSDGDDLIKAAVAAYGDANQEVGDDVVLSQISSASIGAATGIQDITAIRVGIAPSPVQVTNYVIATDEIADLDVSRIVVTTTEV